MNAGDPAPRRPLRVLSLQTPLLGNRTYGELLRRGFARVPRIAFRAHWSTESHDRDGRKMLERQLDRVFLKMVERAAIRERNLDFFPLRFEIGTSYWAKRTLDPLLRAARPDVVHVHTQAIALLLRGAMRRVPTVISLDGTAAQMARQRLAPHWRWTFAGNALLEGAAFRRAAAIVAFSRWSADAVLREYGIPPQRVHVIAPGVELERSAYGAHKVRRGEDEPVRILFVGGEFERKGGPQLVRAFGEAFASGERVELHLMTRDADVPADPRIAVHRGVEAYSERWHELYRRADVFALPTRRDQSPHAFVEAMAAGLPVIATDVGSATELVVDGETGFIVGAGDGELAKRLRQLVTDAELRTRMGAAARAKVEAGYDAAVNVERLADLFEAVARRT